MWSAPEGSRIHLSLVLCPGPGLSPSVFLSLSVCVSLYISFLPLSQFLSLPYCLSFFPLLFPHSFSFLSLFLRSPSLSPPSLSLPLGHPLPLRTPVPQVPRGSRQQREGEPRVPGTQGWGGAGHLVPPPRRRWLRKPRQTPESGTRAPAHPAHPRYLFLAPSAASSLEKPLVPGLLLSSGFPRSRP